jgi:hypothetical protein
MTPIKTALEKAGFRAWSLSYPSTTHGISALAQWVAQEVYRVLGPDPKLLAVTHSLGGIVLRHLHQQCPVERAVMLAPPNDGSRVASMLRDIPLFQWLYGPAGQEVTDASAWPEAPQPCAVIAGTRATSLLNPTSWLTRATKVFGDEPSDGTVAVRETKLPVMAEFHTVDATHSWIMSHPAAQSITVRFLRGT